MIDEVSTPELEEANFSIGENKDDILGASEENDKVPLSKINTDDFEKEQKNCASLAELWKLAVDGNNREFEVRKDRLVRISQSKRGDEVVQLIIPRKIRKDILKLCHDDIGGHLGVQRTKDRVLLNFFWPNCYKDIETYVKTCHECQIVGKPRDKKKAPLKLTSIISEPFSKLAINAIGPVPTTSNNNRHAITAI